MTDFYLTTPSGNTAHVNGDPTDKQAVTAIKKVIDAASKQLKENPPQFFCEYCEYGLEECGKPATHHYFPVPYCGVNFLCSQHAKRLKKLGDEIFQNS
jgi:hypothetical protein